MTDRKPTIAELEAAMDDGIDLEILPTGEVRERDGRELADPVTRGPEVAEMTFTVRAAPEVLGRFVRLMVAMDLASGWGCSRAFGMPLDGDGPERFYLLGPQARKVKRMIRDELNEATATGRSLVLADNASFSSFSLNHEEDQ